LEANGEGLNAQVVGAGIVESIRNPFAYIQPTFGYIYLRMCANKQSHLLIL